MMMKQYLTFILAAALVVGCGGRGSSASQIDPENQYFAGEFIYMADAAVLRDCATGELVAVAMQDGFVELERAYLSLDLQSYQGVMCQVRGYIQDKEDGAEGHDKVLVVKSLIGLDSTESCNPLTTICGEWELTKGAAATKELAINPDYTYSLGNQTQGRWFLSAPDSIVFIDTSEKAAAGTIDYKKMCLNFKEITYSKNAD